MSGTLAMVSDIVFPLQALCYSCSRRPDEGFEFPACTGFISCTRTISCPEKLSPR
jgi:hypothetical protein